MLILILLSFFKRGNRFVCIWILHVSPKTSHKIICCNEMQGKLSDYNMILIIQILENLQAKDKYISAAIPFCITSKIN